MKTTQKFMLLFLLSCFATQAQVWDENTNGDLSDDNANPTGIFDFVMGANTIIAEQRGNPRDVDFFAFTIPSGMELTELIVTNYVSSDDVAFIGIDSGATSDIDFNAPDASLLLGGTSYGTASIGNDILPAMGNLTGADGFVPPLSSGTYTIWLNQTSQTTSSEVTLNFVVDETLGINDNTLQNVVSLYPNPAQNTLRIESVAPVQNLRVYDILGTEVLQTEQSENINIAHLTTGIYITRIETTAGIITKKLIKE